MKPLPLKKGDKVAIVSLSRGIAGMPFCKHEVDLGIKRLRELGLEPVFMTNALLDMDTLASHPELRAADLKQAFLDDSIKGIITAIGGDDTYKLIPYLMEDQEFIEAVKNNPKIFTGFSDTTNNHLMLNKLGLNTFYGPCFLVDIAELDKEMIPYTKNYFEKFFCNDNKLQIISSDIWYSDRESYSSDQLNIPRTSHEEKHGFETLNGSGIAEGKLYGGCIESIYDALTSSRYGDEAQVYEKYNIFPDKKSWSEKILFLETSEEKPTPELLEKMLLELKNREILSLVRGVIVGKPIDEIYYDEYKQIYQKVFKDINTPVLYNLNFGHSVPRCILPYNCNAIVDFDKKTVVINEELFEKER